MDLKRLVAAACMLISTCAAAETYKCIDNDGKVSFAFSPCPTWQGESSVYSGPAASSSAGIGGEESDQRNRRAVDELIRRNGQSRSNGHMGIVRDTASGMGKEQIRQEAIQRRKLERASGVYTEPQPKDQQRKSINFNCYSYGSERQFTQCSGR